MSIIPQVHPDALSYMLKTGRVVQLTRGVFDHFAVAYERMYTRILRSGKRVVLTSAPKVVLSSISEPDTWRDFQRLHPTAERRFMPQTKMARKKRKAHIQSERRKRRKRR